jgi:hypothetical protein
MVLVLEARIRMIMIRNRKAVMVIKMTVIRNLRVDMVKRIKRVLAMVKPKNLIMVKMTKKEVRTPIITITTKKKIKNPWIVKLVIGLIGQSVLLPVAEVEKPVVVRSCSKILVVALLVLPLQRKLLVILNVAK